MKIRLTSLYDVWFQTVSLLSGVKMYFVCILVCLLLYICS